jgi:uncharacterized protein YyaL (SSP411 family)
MTSQCIPDPPAPTGGPPPSPADAAAGNRLGGETSPYLRQHRDNPVHWLPWGEQAFALAKRQDKPILLSIGYAACHWCHVMAHESFEDPDTAALMNEHFVSIKVDREERPDVDAIYQHALSLLGEHGGWPLTMFLTPKAEPIWGGTYFPPGPNFGRPGFPDVLRQLARIYREEPEKVGQNVAALTQALGSLSQAHAGGAIAPGFIDTAASRIMAQMDKRHGGIGGAPKFPQSTMLELLWRSHLRTGAPEPRALVCLTLDQMCQGGIYDHLGGGFARYSVDAMWLVPHFEKMLYDNAQLIDILTLVWQATRAPLYAQRVRETVEWLLREMLVEGGGFAGTLDADSEGEEGRFYVWREAEIDTLLGGDAAFFKAAYDVSAAGNWEGSTILNRRHALELGDEAHEARLAACRRTLLAARASRIRPGRDDKVLADWNGLMIAALANAGQVFDEPGWIDAARAAFDFVRRRMTEDGRLRHSWCDGRAAHPATLDDYACLGRAALALYEATAEPAYLAAAEDWLEIVERHYRDPDGPGYFFSADDTDDLIARAKTAFDNATPAGNAVLAGVLARLYYLTGRAELRERAATLIAAFTGEIDRIAPAIATLINADDLLNHVLNHGLQIVIAAGAAEHGTPGESDAEALRRAVLDASLPNRILQQLGPADALPDGHPAHGKGMVDGKAAAYVCRGPVCSLPITDAAALAAELSAPAPATG